jgi:diguanylate cyclase (GGDEF)-like protein
MWPLKKPLVREMMVVRGARTIADPIGSADHAPVTRLSSILASSRTQKSAQMGDTTPPHILQSPQALADLGIDAASLHPNVRAVIARLTSQVQSLQIDRARLNQKLKEAEDLADTDTLVPVFNRRAFVRELTRVISFAQRYGVQASVVYFDLDGFKQINDRFGHSAGDAILKAIGQTLLANIRESDLAGRVGGDEFAVILAKANSDDARTKGAQLAQAIRQTHVRYMGHTLSVGAAFGAYCFEAGDTAERALSRADEAMYAHKVGRKVQSL